MARLTGDIFVILQSITRGRAVNATSSDHLRGDHLELELPHLAIVVEMQPRTSLPQEPWDKTEMLKFINIAMILKIAKREKQFVSSYDQ